LKDQSSVLWDLIQWLMTCHYLVSFKKLLFLFKVYILNAKLKLPLDVSSHFYFSFKNRYKWDANILQVITVCSKWPTPNSGKGKESWNLVIPNFSIQSLITLGFNPFLVDLNTTYLCAQLHWYTQFANLLWKQKSLFTLSLFF
jgi:hypothetical protein